MATLNVGSNTKDHVFLLTDSDGLKWGEFEEVGGLKVKIDGKVQFFEPGQSFETHAGGNFKIDDIECTRNGKHTTNAPFYKKFLDAAFKGMQIEATGSYHSRLANGTINPTPYVSLPVIIDGCELPDVKSASDKADFKLVLGANGAPTT